MIKICEIVRWLEKCPLQQYGRAKGRNIHCLGLHLTKILSFTVLDKLACKTSEADWDE
jgi:hypothetical protein